MRGKEQKIENGCIYFNNAAGAYPLAPGVLEAVTQALDEPPRIPGRDVSASPDGLRQCRTRLAALLGADESQAVLTTGATYGLNAAIHGLGLKQGDLVVATVMEHNSVLRPLAYLHDRHGVRVEYVPVGADAKLDTAVYDGLLRERPRLVALTHASNVTGRINPVRSLFEKAKSAGAATLLDASQTAGRIPVKPDDLCADMLVFPGYKGLRGPMGTGVLYAAPHIALEPVFAGGTGVKSDLRLMPDEMPARLEPGTPNAPAFAGLNAALGFYMEAASEIAAREKAMTEKLLAGLLDIPDVRVLDKDPLDRLPVISFSIRGMDAETVGFALSESFRIACRAGLHCAPLMRGAAGAGGTVRLSPSYANGDGDIDYALEAVRTVARENTES